MNNRGISLLSIYERDMRTCWLCRLHVGYGPEVFFTPLAPTRDHVVPRSEGGPTTEDNIRLAHAFCNSARDAYAPAHLAVIVRAMMDGANLPRARSHAPRRHAEGTGSGRAAPPKERSRSWSEIMADNKRIRKARKAAGVKSFVHPVRPATSAPMYGVRGEYP